MSDMNHYINQINKNGIIQLDDMYDPEYDYTYVSIPRSCDCHTCELKRRASINMLKSYADKHKYSSAEYDPNLFNTSPKPSN